MEILIFQPTFVVEIISPFDKYVQPRLKITNPPFVSRIYNIPLNRNSFFIIFFLYIRIHEEKSVEQSGKSVFASRILRKTFFTGIYTYISRCWTNRCRAIAIVRRYLTALMTTLSANPATCRLGVDKG